MKSLFHASLLALCGAGLSAQHLVVYDPPAGGFLDLQAPSPFFPGPVPPGFVYPAPPLPPVPPGPPLGLPPGDATLNAMTGANLITNGVLVATVPNAAYPPAAPPPPPFPIGIFGLGLAGPVTGMALDPGAGVLWLTDGMVIVGAAPIPGTPMLVPPFPSPTPPIVGLEWDGLTGTLLALDIGGVVWPLLPGGAPAGPPMFPMGPLAGMPADLAIDKTGMPGIAGPRAIYVLAGPAIVEVASGMVLPAGSPMGVGLSFHPYPAATPPLGVCPCPSFAHGYGVTGPMTAGNAAFGLTVTGLPPGQLVLYAFDFAFNPLYPLINGVGCGFGLFLGSPTLVSGVAFAGPGGTAVYPLPLLVPPGTGPIYHQSGTPCPADPAGFVLNPTLQLAVCGL